MLYIPKISLPKISRVTCPKISVFLSAKQTYTKFFFFHSFPSCDAFVKMVEKVRCRDPKLRCVGCRCQWRWACKWRNQRNEHKEWLLIEHWCLVVWNFVVNSNMQRSCLMKCLKRDESHSFNSDQAFLPPLNPRACLRCSENWVWRQKQVVSISDWLLPGVGVCYPKFPSCLYCLSMALVYIL
jgi:hypothetical protein